MQDRECNVTHSMVRLSPSLMGCMNPGIFGLERRILGQRQRIMIIANALAIVFDAHATSGQKCHWTL